MTASDIIASIPAPTEDIDLDARGEAYRADAILRDRRSYFAANCPRAYLDFDPDFPAIQRNRPQINQVGKWQFGAVGILASGETALGKTRSMFALCRRLMCDEGRDVAIWHAKDWFSELQANVRYGNDEAASFVKRTAERPILFIDDYGQEAILRNREEWATGWFFRMLDMRIGNQLPVLMTTNLTARQMAEGGRDVTGSPLVRRLLELAEPVKFL